MGESKMAIVSIHYGFDKDHLYVRLDPPHAEDGKDKMASLRGTEIRLLLRAGEQRAIDIGPATGRERECL